MTHITSIIYEIPCLRYDKAFLYLKKIPKDQTISFVKNTI